MDKGDVETNSRPSITVTPKADEVRERRILAFALMIVAALFSGVVTGVMVATHLSEDEQPQNSQTLEMLRTALEKNPGSQELKEAIRKEDQRLLKVYFTHRRRMKWGAYLLLVGLASVALCAKWYVALDPKTPAPKALAERPDLDQRLGIRRHNLQAIGVMGGVLGLGLIILAVWGGRRYEELGSVQMDNAQREAALEPKKTEVQLTPQKADTRFKENWPRFRGPMGMGTVRAGDWPDNWDAKTDENILWKTEIPAPGKSSPIVWGSRVFLTGGDAEKREVFCFERGNGKLLWRTTIESPPKNKSGDEEDEELEIMKDTGYAAPTPATDGKRIYVTYATADLAAVDFNGKVVWTRNMGKPENTYGMAASLLVYKNLLIFQLDRGVSADDNLSAILGIDTDTGKVIWRTPRPVPSSWSTPIIADTETRPELVTCADPWVIAYDPQTGRELWRAKALSGDVAPSSVFANGMVFVTNEYAQLAAIRAGGSGDVTETHIAWTADEGMSDASSPICDGKLFLQAHSGGFVNCYDALKGKMLWEQEFDCEFWASPTLVGNRVYLPGKDGKTYIFELAEKYKLLSTGSVNEPMFASPAFADSQIYIRGKKHLFCVGKRG